ncbi:MAG: 6-bladed beta-propeller [Tannerellaceae bacterium]|jgi:hypothetical protein|nr:6-bladed beta-propeller [Tannerellaceae bacterium]
MKKVSVKELYIIFFSLCVSLLGCKDNTSGELIEFDLEGNYPSKILDVRDVADIEYLLLKTTDNNYLFKYIRSVGDNFVVCVNNTEQSFLFFSRETGEPAGKVSRYGNGPEEYNLASVYTYSEDKDELFVFGYNTQGIKVYGMDGTFKRQLTFRERSYPASPESLYDYDEDNLLLYDTFQGEVNDYSTAFILMSKKDGHTTEEILIPRREKLDLAVRPEPNSPVARRPTSYSVVRNGTDFLITDYSTDTVYRFTPERILIPVLVRKPSIHSTGTKTVLNSWLETDNYLFFSTQKMEFDWNTMKGLPEKCYLMEKRSGRFFNARVSMNDYRGKELILGPPVLSKTTDSQTGLILLPASELSGAAKDCKLSGKLKEITEQIAEDDEFVLMILKFR